MNRKEDNEAEGKCLLAFHPVCDYCEVLCEILIFRYHISLIFFFFRRGPWTRTQKLCSENCHQAVLIAKIILL